MRELHLLGPCPDMEQVFMLLVLSHQSLVEGPRKPLMFTKSAFARLSVGLELQSPEAGWAFPESSAGLQPG